MPLLETNPRLHGEYKMPEFGAVNLLEINSVYLRTNFPIAKEDLFQEVAWCLEPKIMRTLLN